MGRRRRGREFALKILYRLDLTGEAWEEVRKKVGEYDKNESVLEFGTVLIETVLRMKEHIDPILDKASEHWRLERMPIVDRNVLRIALAEHLVRAEPPLPVIINEAVEIVKTFSTDESGRFVNGILDRILHDEEAGSLAGVE